MRVAALRVQQPYKIRLHHTHSEGMTEAEDKEKAEKLAAAKKKV